MKKKNQEKKLVFNKTTVSRLNPDAARHIKGGKDEYYDSKSINGLSCKLSFGCPSI